MKPKFCYCDFEFNNSQNPDPNLVSVAWRITGSTKLYSAWLHSSKRDWDESKAIFRRLIGEGYTFVAYAMESEARCLMYLLDDKLEGFKAIDLYLEYRALLNHNHALAYGKQLQNGKLIETKPPVSKWDRPDNYGDESHGGPEYSLAAACYKLLGERIDLKEKESARQIIIEGDPDRLEQHRERILRYNASDIEYLPRLAKAVYWHNLDLGVSPADWTKAALVRGDYAVATARMVDLGYPVNVGRLRNFAAHTNDIMKEVILECNEEASKEDAARKDSGETGKIKFSPFRWDKKTQAYVCQQKVLRGWVDRQFKPYWRKTERGQISLAADAFGDWYDSRSEGFAGAYCRYLKTKRSMNGFLPVGPMSLKKTFWESLGDDGRVRPYFGIYGSQASRSQPAATGFIPLKSNWMRVFIEAEPGRALASIDYASQEFLISAILSQDSAMMSAYASGDVYLAFGKASGLIPPEATKESHKMMRDVCKALVLGISYDMSARGLSPRLTQASGVTYTPMQAKSLIDVFYETYPDFKDWKDNIRNEYTEYGCLKLHDGWTMWGDNDNFRSAGNFPVQGTGAVIMREAVRLAQARGLDVIFTLHDALYIEYNSFDFNQIVLLKHSMQEAFENVMKNYGKTISVRLDAETWSRDYKDRKFRFKNCKVMEEYVGEKGLRDYERFRKYL